MKQEIVANGKNCYRVKAIRFFVCWHWVLQDIERGETQISNPLEKNKKNIQNQIGMQTIHALGVLWAPEASIRLLTLFSRWKGQAEIAFVGARINEKTNTPKKYLAFEFKSYCLGLDTRVVFIFHSAKKSRFRCKLNCIRGGTLLKGCEVRAVTGINGFWELCSQDLLDK